MAKKTKKAPQTIIRSQESNPFAPAYAARLARQVTQELSSARQASVVRKSGKRAALGSERRPSCVTNKNLEAAISATG